MADVHKIAAQIVADIREREQEALADIMREPPGPLAVKAHLGYRRRPRSGPVDDEGRPVRS